MDRIDARHFRIAPLWLLLALLTASAARAQAYLVEDLGTLGGDLSGALDVDETGVVVGLSRIAGSSLTHGFVYDGAMLDLGTLGGTQSGARGINQFDEVVGWSLDPAGVQHAFLFKNGTMIDLGTFGSYSDARGINDSREIVGSSGTVLPSHERAFVWRGAGLIDLGTLGGTESRAYAINENSEICGFAQNSAGDLRPFLYRDGQMIDLGSLGGWAGHAYALNNTGKVVGWSMMIPNNLSHAFLWSEGTLIDLGTLGGVYSAAFGINDAGLVVGASTRANGLQAAFIWNGAKLVDLNTRIPENSGWFLTSASAINEDGRIVGIGSLNGQVHAYRLTPDDLLDVRRGEIHASLRLVGATPNPMRASTDVRFSLPGEAPARVSVFDLTGRRVRLLADRSFPAGLSHISWDGRDERGASVESGVYWLRLEAMGRAFSSRVAVLR